MVDEEIASGDGSEGDTEGMEGERKDRKASEENES